MNNRKTFALALAILAAGSPLWAMNGPAAVNTAQTPAATAEKGQAEFDAGRDLFFRGDYRGALDKLAAAVRADPSKSSYRLLLAKAYRRSGQDKSAIESLESLLKDNPEHVDAAVELCELLTPQKEPDRVIALLEPLLKFRHDYPLFNLLARAQYQKDNLEKAREYFDEAVRLNPSSGADYELLGNVRLAQKRFALAATAYEAAATQGVDGAAYHFKLASAYFNLRNHLGVISRQVVLGGKVGEIRDGLLLLDSIPEVKDTFYVASPKSAIYQAVLARQKGIDSPQLRFLEANIWLGARRYSRADAIYKDLEKKMDKSDQGLFWFQWSQAALGLGDLEGHLAKLQSAVAAEPEVYKPTLADAFVTVANRYQERGKPAECIKYLVQAVNANPLSPSLHLTLADAHWQSGQKNEAIQQYRMVLELEPDHADRVRLMNRIRGQAN